MSVTYVKSENSDELSLTHYTSPGSLRGMARDTRKLAERLTEMRKTAGLTKVELTRRSGVSRQTIHEIESGARLSPTVDTLKALARACGRDPLYLIEASLQTGGFESAMDGLDEAAQRRGVPAPSPEERRWLRDLPPALWTKIPPDADVLLDQIETERRRRLRQSPQ